MSDRIYQSIDLPQGYKANPMTIAHAVGDALNALEKRLKAREPALHPIWDTVEIETEHEHDVIEDRAFGQATLNRTSVTIGTVSVLVIDPKEAAQ